MPDNPHWFSVLFTNKYVKVPVIITAFALMIIVLYGMVKILSGSHMNVFGVEFNIPKPPDTIYAKEEIKPIVNQKVDSGSSGVVINGPNSGNVAGRDLNVSNEKSLTTIELKSILKRFNKIKKENNITSDTIPVYITGNSNGQKVYNQIKKYLQDLKYTVSGGQWFVSDVKGIDVSIQEKIPMIIVGFIE